jgi:hypothetical protein
MNVIIDPIVTAFREGGFLLVFILFVWIRGPLMMDVIARVATLRLQNQHSLAIGDQTIAARLLDQFERTQLSDDTIRDMLTGIVMQLDTLQRNVNLIIDHVIKGESS